MTTMLEAPLLEAPQLEAPPTGPRNRAEPADGAGPSGAGPSGAGPSEVRRRVVPASALRLAVAARRALDEAEQASDVGERYAAAHLAALRAAAAVLAADALPEEGRRVRRGRPTSVWTLLVRVAPELGEWASFFAAGADKRVAAQAGMRGAVSAREADDLARDAGLFLDLVTARLTLPPASQAALPLGIAPAYPPNRDARH